MADSYQPAPTLARKAMNQLRRVATRLAQNYKTVAFLRSRIELMTNTNASSATAVSPIPAGYRTLTPYLAVPDGPAAIDFYVTAFGAEVISKMDGPNGILMHGELRIGDSMLQLSTEMPDYGLKAPEPGWIHSSLVVYVPDIDAFVDRAVDAGAVLHTPVSDTFSGDRHGVVMDPFGHRWAVCTKIEDVPVDEIARRAREMFFADS
jgi:uncharacterized glyoxalase superfamily protein PhnB